ncbi:hypothetical protein ACFPU0_01560 [Pseudomonas sp. GCM10022186]|uniref:hypothetical protein n=1 Tax=Pseudomonas sp. GCM10022186 TaxID=3252650 RepID=UPI00362228F5
MQSKLTLNDSRIFILILVVSCLSGLDYLVDGARYIKYAALPITLLILSVRKFKIPKEISEAELPFLALLVWPAISIMWGNLELGAKDVFFIASYIVPLALFQKRGVSIESVFYIYTAVFFVSAITRDFGQLSISESTSPLEGSESFVFGAFALAFAMNKKRALTIISLLLLIITLKRIALLGFLVCMLLWMMPGNLKNILVSRAAVLSVNALVVATIVIFTSGALDDVILEFTGKTPSGLTLGRNELYAGVVQDMILHPYGLLFGNGAGTAYERALVMYHGELLKPNLHCDTLKIFYEYGILFFAYFFYSMGGSKESKTRIMAVYISVLFATDNVIIYSNTMFIVLYISYRLANPQLRQDIPATGHTVSARGRRSGPSPRGVSRANQEI